MALEFKTTYTPTSLPEKRLKFSTTRTDDSTSPDTVDTVSGSTQITPTNTKAVIMERIGVAFDEIDAKDAASNAMVSQFEIDTDTYLNGRE